MVPGRGTITAPLNSRAGFSFTSRRKIAKENDARQCLTNVLRDLRVLDTPHQCGHVRRLDIFDDHMTNLRIEVALESAQSSNLPQIDFRSGRLLIPGFRNGSQGAGSALGLPPAELGASREMDIDRGRLTCMALASLRRRQLRIGAERERPPLDRDAIVIATLPRTVPHAEKGAGRRP